MSTPVRRRLSRFVGWLADRRIPGPLRAPVCRAYCALTGADPGEAQLALGGYASLSAFFVRRLKPGARAIDDDPDALVAPCDGTVLECGTIRAGEALQAKGRAYPVRELLGGAGDDLELEGGSYWTIYLSPRDYHRVHSPIDARLTEVRWIPGARRSVAPKIVARRDRLLATNERAVLRLESERGPCLLVMVGALNVGRIRVVGVRPGTTPDVPPVLERGAELARFELGSTVVLVCPAGGAKPAEGLATGTHVRLGSRIGTLAARSAASATVNS